MALDDLSEFSHLFPTWQSLVWAIVGVAAGVVTYRLLLPWAYAGWVAGAVGLVGFVVGRAWHARRDSRRSAARLAE